MSSWSGRGTGIAPFRSFLQEREPSKPGGKSWLFFGDQTAADDDFLYREELERCLSAGVLTRLDTAFSRDQAQEPYVQHRMLEHQAELWTWLTDGAHFYVCGAAVCGSGICALMSSRAQRRICLASRRLRRTDRSSLRSDR